MARHVRRGHSCHCLPCLTLDLEALFPSPSPQMVGRNGEFKVALEATTNDPGTVLRGPPCFCQNAPCSPTARRTTRRC